MDWHHSKDSNIPCPISGIKRHIKCQFQPKQGFLLQAEMFPRDLIMFLVKSESSLFQMPKFKWVQPTSNTSKLPLKRRQHEDGVLRSVGEWPWSACLGVHGSAMSTCVPHTPPPHMSQSAIPSQHTEGSGVGNQFFFSLSFLTNDTLTVGSKNVRVGGTEQISQLQK